MPQTDHDSTTKKIAITEHTQVSNAKELMEFLDFQKTDLQGTLKRTTIHEQKSPKGFFVLTYPYRVSLANLQKVIKKVQSFSGVEFSDTVLKICIEEDSTSQLILAKDGSLFDISMKGDKGLGLNEIPVIRLGQFYVVQLVDQNVINGDDFFLYKLNKM